MPQVHQVCGAQLWRLAPALTSRATTRGPLFACCTAWESGLQASSQLLGGQRATSVQSLIAIWSQPGLVHSTEVGAGPVTRQATGAALLCSSWTGAAVRSSTPAPWRPAGRNEQLPAAGEHQKLRRSAGRLAKRAESTVTAAAAASSAHDLAGGPADQGGGGPGDGGPSAAMTAAARLLKGLMFVGLAVAAYEVLPNMGQGSVEQAVKLLGAQEPFLQRSGAARVRKLAGRDQALRALLGERAPARLLALLCPDGDAGVMAAVLDALAALCRLEEGREACILAGGVDALEEAVRGEWLQEGPARSQAAELLVVLTIQRDNVD